MELDLSYLLTLLIEVMAGALLTVGTWALKRFADRLKLDADSEVRKYLLDALKRSIDYGAEQARRHGQELSDVQVRSNVTNQAVSYLLSHVPDALKRFGITPDKAASMVEARLPSWMPEEETRGVG